MDDLADDSAVGVSARRFLGSASKRSQDLAVPAALTMNHFELEPSTTDSV